MSPDPTQEVCSVRVGETLYGIPIAHLLEIVGKPGREPIPLAPSFIGGLVHYRGEVLAAVSLRRLLGLEPAGAAEDVLVFEGASEQFGVMVDAVGEILNVSAADFEPNPATLNPRLQALFSGVWKLSDRLLIRLEPERLDPMHLISACPV